MYQLVKGRETVHGRSPKDKKTHAPGARDEADPTVGRTRSAQAHLARAIRDGHGRDRARLCLSILTASWSLRVPSSETVYVPLPRANATPDLAVASARRCRRNRRPPSWPSPRISIPYRPRCSRVVDGKDGSAPTASVWRWPPSRKKGVKPKSTRAADAVPAGPDAGSPALPAGSSGLAASPAGVLSAL